jgi:hypothetical protein
MRCRMTLMQDCLALLAVGIVGGCGSATQTVWSVESKSPDGRWVATAKTDQTSGPANAFAYTEVELKSATRSDSAVTILGFPAESLGNSNTAPELEWIASRHLQVSFRCTPKFDTHVIRYAGIEISVREMLPCSDRSRMLLFSPSGHSRPAAWGTKPEPA